MRRTTVRALSTLALTLSVSLHAGCGAELDDDDAAANAAEPQAGVALGKADGALFWDKAAYVLSDDNDAGWKASTDALLQQLGNRKYLAMRLNGAGALAALRADLQSKSMIINRVLIVVNGHGTGVDFEAKGILTGNSDWIKHRVVVGKGTNTDSVSTAQLGALVQDIRAMGKRVSILDNSCQGGSTVRHIEMLFPKDTGVCALSTTGTVTASGVGFPRYQDVIGSTAYGNVGSIGLWASQRLTDVAHGTNGEPRNDRVHQYGYMNGCSKSMLLREGLGTAVGGLTTWPTYNRKRHNHVFLEPGRYLDRSTTALNDPNYAPDPDTAAASAGFEKISVRSQQHLDSGNAILAYTSAPSYLKARKDVLFGLVKDDVQPALKSWQNKFLWADFVAEQTKICNVSLGKRIATLAKHPACGLLPVTWNCSQSDGQRLVKYYGLSCKNPTQLVPTVLADYPLLKQAIQQTVAAEKTARDKVRATSMYLYKYIEGEICQASACAAIPL